MSQYSPAPSDKDPHLWAIAQRRASFKVHLGTYAIINAFFWVLWYFSGGKDANGLPWPVWPSLGWGIGLLFHFMGAYVYHGTSSVEREYDKLTKK